MASALLAAPVITLYVTSPSSTKSSTPVIVIVCAAFQFDDVNVTLEAEIVPSAVLLLLSAIVTSAVGWEFKTIVKLLVPPASVVVNPEVGETVIPAVSLSLFETETLDGFTPL